jgi:hypothetical protein
MMTKVLMSASNMTMALKTPNRATGGKLERASVAKPKASASEVAIIGVSS